MARTSDSRAASQSPRRHKLQQRKSCSFALFWCAAWSRFLDLEPRVVLLYPVVAPRLPATLQALCLILLLSFFCPLSSACPPVVLFLSPVVLVSFYWCPDDSVAASRHDAAKGNQRVQCERHSWTYWESACRPAGKREDCSTAAWPRGSLSACKHDNARARPTKR